MVSWCDAREVVLKVIPIREWKSLLLEVRETSSPVLKNLNRNCKNISGVGWIQSRAISASSRCLLSLSQENFCPKDFSYNSLIRKREKHGCSGHTGGGGPDPCLSAPLFPHCGFSSSHCSPMKQLENLGSLPPASWGLWKLEFHWSLHLDQQWPAESGTSCHELGHGFRQWFCCIPDRGLPPVKQVLASCCTKDRGPSSS